MVNSETLAIVWSNEVEQYVKVSSRNPLAAGGAGFWLYRNRPFGYLNKYLKQMRKTCSNINLKRFQKLHFVNSSSIRLYQNNLKLYAFNENFTDNEMNFLLSSSKNT